MDYFLPNGGNVVVCGKLTFESEQKEEKRYKPFLTKEDHRKKGKFYIWLQIELRRPLKSRHYTLPKLALSKAFKVQSKQISRKAVLPK